MIFSDLFREAWVSITASRLRTFLAMLGIVIGVGSVILMLAVGAGSRRSVQEAVDKLGSNLLIVTPGNSENKGLRSDSISKLSDKDAAAIAQLPSIIGASPSTAPRDFQISHGNQNWYTRVSGTTPDFFPIRSWEFSEGSAFTEEDLKLGKRVAVIGATVAKKLFDTEQALGKSLRISSTPFQIVGILASKGQGFDGRDQDDTVIIPITTAQSKLWGYTYIQGIIQLIFVQAVSKEALNDATDEITDLLRKRHKLRDVDADDFTVRSLSSIAQTATDITRTLSLLLGAIAAISLVVGSIGIMNIMLVTVTERTREIGIRKAIGATERNILIQFLLEAIIIAGVGSIVGFLVGVGFGLSAQKWMQIQVEFSIWSVLLAFGVAVGVGLFSGLYPAFKAARMQPIEALRTN